MSELNAETARGIIDAFNAGLDEFMACHAEDIVHVTAPQWPEAGTYRGKKAVRGLWESMFAAQEHSAELEEMVVLDAERVLSVIQVHTRGASSGADLTTPIYTIFMMREGLIARVEYFVRREEALRAAGLPEAAGAP